MDKTSDDQHLCWNCKTSIGFLHFCNTCVKIQPTPSGEDYFAFFELPKKLVVDNHVLEKKFYELSRKLHPDTYQKSSTLEKQIALEKSSILNHAYETLKNPWQRADYMLDIENYSTKMKEQKTSPEFLKEMFDIQEAIDSMKQAKLSVGPEKEKQALNEKLNQSLNSVREKLNSLEKNLNQIFKEWDNSSNSDVHAKLADQIQKLTHEKKYLDTALHTAENALEA